MKVNKIHLYVLVGLILLNLGFYFVNLNDFFVSDDFDWLYNAKTSEYSLTDYFAANYYGERGVGGSYRPMVNFVFLSAYKFFGLNPLPYHLLNLFFHIGTCFLVYLLTLLLLGEDKNKQKIAVLASVFFSILPNHSEAVIWIAAVADPLATFFYISAFYLYLIFRKQLKFWALLLSVLSFIIALLTKEIAITLPLLIVIWELYEAFDKNKYEWKDIILKPFGYWLVLLLYFIVRYFSIGLLFGYYAQTKIKFDFNKIIEMFISLITNLFFYGQLRVYLTNYLFDNKIFFFLVLFLLITVVWLFLREQRYKFPFLFDSFCVLILPVLFLSFGLLSDDGERYNYLPSVIFCIFLSLFVWNIKFDKFIRNLALVSLLIYFSLNLINKNYNWQLAASLSRQMLIVDLPQAVDLTTANQKLFFVSMPDNLSGAQVMRNGLDQAVKLYYPNILLDTQQINAYLRLNRENFQRKMLYWGPYPTGGYIAETFDQRYWVTGFDRRETADYIFELWYYNYDNYTSGTIRLVLKDKDGKFIPAGEELVQVLIFNEGHLRNIK